MAKSNYLETKLYDHVLRAIPYTPPATLWVSLWSTDPTDAGSGSELSGSGYIRAQVTFGAPSGGAGVNTNPVQFTNSTGTPWASAGYFGVHDAQSGGNLLYHAALTGGGGAVGAYQTWQFSPGQLSLAET